MAPRRTRPVDEVYKQEIEQRIMTRLEKRLNQFADQLADRLNEVMNPRRRGNDEDPGNLFADDAYSDDEPDPSRQNLREDDRRWESGLRVNIPEFDGNTLNPKGFIDWLVTIEEVFEFKEVPEKKRVPLIATKLRGRASAWWQQLKLTREKVGKSRVADWVKMKKLLRENFIPHNYKWLMYQRLQNLKQVSKGVRDSNLKCFNCGEPGHRQSECQAARKKTLFIDMEEDDEEAGGEYDKTPVYDEEPEYEEEYVSEDVGEIVSKSTGALLTLSQFEEELEVGDDVSVLIGKEVAEDSKIPKTMIPLLKELHSEGHVGRDRTLQLVQASYF
nr:reverse transcriptase domain-containing protein [Tanacetum cinerariifolium]